MNTLTTHPSLRLCAFVSLCPGSWVLPCCCRVARLLSQTLPPVLPASQRLYAPTSPASKRKLKDRGKHKHGYRHGLPEPTDTTSLPRPPADCHFQQTSIADMEWPTPHPPSFPSPSPATADTVLPHADIDPTQLANQASHLTLSAEPSPPVRALSAAASPPSDCDGDGNAPQQPTTCWIVGPLPGTATASTPGPAAAAQPVPPASRDHACGGSSATDERRLVVDQDEAADRQSGAVVPGLSYRGSGPWSVQRGGAVARLVDLPNEVLLLILGFLDVPDLLATSRVSAPALSSLRPCRDRYTPRSREQGAGIMVPFVGIPLP